MSEWKSIESAPRDGTEVLVCGGTYYSDGGGAGSDGDIELSGVRIVHWYRDEWYMGYGDRYNEELWASPRLWMPLPSIPQHASDCAVHNEPAYPKGECDCGAFRPAAPQAPAAPVANEIDIEMSPAMTVGWARDEFGRITDFQGFTDGWNRARMMLIKGEMPPELSFLGKLHHKAAPPAPTLEVIEAAAEEIVVAILHGEEKHQQWLREFKPKIIAIISRHITPMQATEKEE